MGTLANIRVAREADSSGGGFSELSVSPAPGRAEEFFCHRFSFLTAEQQAGMLARVAQQTKLTLLGTFHHKFGQAGAGTGTFHESSFAEEQAKYLAATPQERFQLFQRLCGCDERLQTFIEKEFFTQISRYYPGIVVALNHIYSGGLFGYLTARSSEEGCAPLFDAISHFLGHAPHVSPQCVNDKKNADLVHLEGGAEKKLARSALAMHYEKVTLLDDEPRNVNTIRNYVTWAIVTDYKQKSGAAQTSYNVGNGLPARQERDGLVDMLTARAAANGVREKNLFRSVLKRLGKEFGTQVSQKLSFRLTGDVCIETEWESLLKKLKQPDPPAFGSRRHLLLLDIDNTLVNLEGDIYVRDRRDPHGAPILTMSQEQIAADPMNESWLKRAARENPHIPPDCLYMDYSNMDQYKLVAAAVERQHHEMFIQKKYR